jgi:hypothetical protein
MPIFLELLSVILHLSNNFPVDTPVDIARHKNFPIQYITSCINNRGFLTRDIPVFKKKIIDLQNKTQEKSRLSSNNFIGAKKKIIGLPFTQF